MADGMSGGVRDSGLFGTFDPLNQREKKRQIFNARGGKIRYYWKGGGVLNTRMGGERRGGHR